MSEGITRRRALITGTAAAGMFAGSGENGSAASVRYDDSKGPGREKFWGPGPDKNMRKDLTPGSTPIRLAGYLRYEEGMDAGEAVKALSDKGFHGAIAGADMVMGLKDSVLREMKSALREYDVIVFEVGGYRNLLHTDEKMRQEYIKRIAFCLEAAEKIGCSMVGTISGSRNPEGNQWVDNYAVHPDNWTLETWNLLLKSLRQILDDTAGLKAAIGMEAQVTTNIDGPLAHKRLMEDMKSDRIKVNLDPTNMVHLYNHFHTTELINECFDLLGEDIYGCHAKDTHVLPHSQTVHVQEVCPGRGNLDYETYLVRLSHMKWSRSLLPEHIPADQFDEAYAYLRKVAAKVGVKIYGDV